MTELQKWSQEAVAWLEGAVKSPSSIDWVLIALAAGVLYRLWAALRSRTQLGPVEVELLECDGTKVSVHALTALLRERLANSGLPAPPAVPAGAPQTDLVSAIAASPIPHAAWIASLLGLLRPPQPLQYELSGTIFGDDPASDCGISFWLRPSRPGPALLKTVDRAATHKAAVESAAAKIYVHISKDAVGAFPVWTRWHCEAALHSYDAGRTHVEAGRLNAALESLNMAAELERDNALAHLQLANLCEQMAETLDEKTAVLRRYLDIAIEWPWLVEARYRVSVLASALAGSNFLKHKTKWPKFVNEIAVEEAGDEPLDRWLSSLSRRESKAVRQLLRPWYTLLRQGRRRNQFEPRGRARRQLKRNVSYSMRVRNELNHGATPGGPDASLPIRIKAWLVRWWYLSALRGNVTWQTHYIAACFYARVLARERQKNASKQLQVWLHAHAFSHLNRAIDEADSNLSNAWIAKNGDPDLESLRVENDPDWKFVLSRLGLSAAETPTKRSKEILGQYSVRLPDRDPARPWPRLRVGALRCPPTPAQPHRYTASAEEPNGRGEFRTPETGVARLPVFKTRCIQPLCHPSMAEPPRLPTRGGPFVYRRASLNPRHPPPTCPAPAPARRAPAPPVGPGVPAGSAIAVSKPLRGTSATRAQAGRARARQEPPRRPPAWPRSSWRRRSRSAPRRPPCRSRPLRTRTSAGAPACPPTRSGSCGMTRRARGSARRTAACLRG